MLLRFLPKALRTRFEGQAYLQKIVSNTGWQFADSLTRMGVGLFVGVWVARYLGPDGFGTFSYAIALVALFVPLSAMGLEDIVVRELVKAPASTDETLGSAFYISLLGGSITFLLAVAVIMALRPDDSTSHWLVAVIALGSVVQAWGVIEYWLHANLQAKYLAFARSGAFFIAAALKIALLLSHAPLLAFAWAYTLEIALCSAGLILVFNRRGQNLSRWRMSLGRAGSLVKDSWPLFFTSVVITVYLRIDQVMLGGMAGSNEVGVYSVAVRLAEVWLFVPTAIFSSVFPAIVAAREESLPLMFERLQKLYNLMALSGLLIAIPVTFIAGRLVTGLFGPAYARAEMMLILLVWANLFTFLEIARSAFLSSMNWTRLHLVTTLLGAAVNVGLNFLLIPHYGGVGAAFASLVAYWFAAHGSCFLLKPLFQTGQMLTRAVICPKIW